MELLPTVTVSDFLPSQDLNDLVTTIMNNSHPVEYRGHDVLSQSTDLVSIRHVLNENKLKDMADLLSDKMFPLLGKSPIFKELWILEEYQPLGWHTDCHHVCTDPGEDQFYTIIIPIETIQTSTIVANEHGWVMPNPLDGLVLAEYARSARIVPLDQRFTKEFWKDQLSHCPDFSRSLFTPHSQFQWTQGSLLAFDRRRWHASDNFIKNNISCKKAIVSFTNVDSL